MPTVEEPAQELGLLGYLNEIQEPLRLADLTQHSRSVGFPENHSPMKWGRRRGRARGSKNEVFPRHSLLRESKELPTW